MKEGLSKMYRRGAPLCSSPTTESSSYGQWANLPYELLLDIIQRVEASETSWPSRRALVACASVCRSWREITKGIVKTLEQCALSGENSKLLLAAKKIRRATSMNRANFIATKFMIFDGHPPHDSSLLLSCILPQRIHQKQVLPKAAPATVTVTVSYRLNILPANGLRRIQCTMHLIPMSSVREGGTAPTPLKFSSTCTDFESEQLILENKAPRWNQQLQCWCLNFKGRVTVASVKNFQLIISTKPYQLIPDADDETVILQFGRIGKDIFTMDYRYPLSAFQAFAICLSAFDTKPVCE
ncbi:hypothetical protein TSUD_03380 [Trifolium subterraneum]|nr:hypothetical protein TSUD_03380 [Trifolium subterraneum]